MYHEADRITYNASISACEKCLVAMCDMSTCDLVHLLLLLTPLMSNHWRALNLPHQPLEAAYEAGLFSRLPKAIRLEARAIAIRPIRSVFNRMM